MRTYQKLTMGTACYHVLHAVPPMVAHEMNLFVDEGLVDEHGSEAYQILPGGLIPFNSEKSALRQAMKERGADVVMDVHPSTVVYLNRRGGGLRIIAGWRNAESSLVMGAPHVRTPEDIAGRVVGVKDYFNNRYHALAPLLSAQGIDPQKDVTYVRNIQDGSAALREATVDVAFVPADEGDQMAQEGYTLLFDLAKEHPVHPTRVIAATEEFLDACPEWTISFLKGIVRSYWFIRTMPDNLTYVSNLERRLRRYSPDPDERNSRYLACASPSRCERMPFPVDGIPHGLEAYLSTWVSEGHLDEDDAAFLDKSTDFSFMERAYDELKQRDDLKPTITRIADLVDRFGY